MKKLPPSKSGVTGNHLRASRNSEIFFRLHHSLLREKHPDAGKNQERAEDIKHPVEFMDERHADGDHRRRA